MKQKTNYTVLLLSVAFLLFQPGAATARVWPFKKGKARTEETVSPNKYKELTGRDSCRMKSLVNAFQKEKEWYFEIPSSLLGRDLLLVNRLERVPQELNEAGVNQGLIYEHKMVRFAFSADRKSIVVRQQRPMPMAPEGDAINHSLVQNYISPLIENLEVEAFSPDSLSAVVKVTPLYNGDEVSFNDAFNSINIHTSAKPKLSRIVSVRTFKDNVLVRSELTTRVTEGHDALDVTMEVASSLFLLPEKPMPVRYDTRRLGFFTTDRLFYSDTQQRVEQRHFITRWRLEPSDTAAYLRGELVPPVRPITFCFGDDVPAQWRPWMERGALLWNKAFERAGFRDAIVCAYMPDSTAHRADDMNYNRLTYVASTRENAFGPSTLDPRTGEILEADIMWWHNVVQLVSQWLTIQTGAVDSRVRSLAIPDSILGPALSYVLCHEVGHSLGLRHNMMASAAIPTDSLRSRTFTDRFQCTASSVMDYARFNYVAQPSDHVQCLMPMRVGPYDELAIEYAYRWYGGTPEQERDSLIALLDAHQGPLYRYCEQQPLRDAIDPRGQMEDLGDDVLRSAELGMDNLKRIMPHLLEWSTTGEKDQSYEEVSRMFYGVINQWNLYLYHAMANVGGIYIDNTSVGDGRQTFTHVPRERQQQAVDFLLRHALSNPSWLFGTSLSDLTYLNRNTPNGVIEYVPSLILRNGQSYIIYDLLRNERLMRMLENERRNGAKAYTVVELMDALHRHIFATTLSGLQPDVATRDLQKLFVDLLITDAESGQGIRVKSRAWSAPLGTDSFLSPELPLCSERSAAARTLDFYGSQTMRASDAISVKRGELLRVYDLLKQRRNTGSQATQYHYQDLILRIHDALNLP